MIQYSQNYMIGKTEWIIRNHQYSDTGNIAYKTWNMRFLFKVIYRQKLIKYIFCISINDYCFFPIENLIASLCQINIMDVMFLFGNTIHTSWHVRYKYKSLGHKYKFQNKNVSASSLPPAILYQGNHDSNQLSRGGPIDRFNPATSLCLSKLGLGFPTLHVVVFLCSMRRLELIVRFVDIAGIVDNYCLSFHNEHKTEEYLLLIKIVRTIQ